MAGSHHKLAMQGSWSYFVRVSAWVSQTRRGVLELAVLGLLAGEPRWLLADEPLAALDPSHQADLLDRLRAFAGEGRGVAVVLHDLVHAQRAADDAMLLHHGRVVAFGPAAEVLTPDHLQAVFGVRLVEARDGARTLWVPAGR